MRITPCIPVLAGFLAASVLPARAAVTEDTFQLRNTGDLRELCFSTQSDPLFTPAQNFCQGFMVGVFRVLQEEDVALRSRHLFCMPKAMPTRNEAIASFVQWARANPDQMGQPAIDGVATFLSQQYPCGHVG